MNKMHEVDWVWIARPVIVAVHQMLHFHLPEFVYCPVPGANCADWTATACGLILRSLNLGVNNISVLAYWVFSGLENLTCVLFCPHPVLGILLRQRAGRASSNGGGPIRVCV